MEAQVEHVQIVQMSISSVITIASSIIIALSGTIAILFRMLEKKNEVIIELTKSFIETTLGVKTTLENNTKVIEKLPEEIAMQVKLNSRK